MEIMNLKKFKFREFIKLIENHPWIIFITATAIIFFLFRNLFGSYFEADEWFHFTYYFPLTRQPDGFLTALVSTIINSGPLSGGQHVSPIATVILFLSTKFFGLNFVPYAFVTLLLHTLNSFLVFLLIKILLYTMKQTTKNVFAFMGAVFFALAPAPIHTVTGAAAFYSYNVLSVTFFLLCIISFKTAYIKSEKKFIYFSFLLLFGALFTKETTAFLFLLLPFMAIIEKRIFSLKFLGKLFIFCLIVYAVFRFLVPNIYQGTGQLIDKLVDVYILKGQTNTTVDTGTIVSRDLSIHKNLPAEILFRAVTFPIRMTGTLFLPREVTLSVVKLITPIVYPLSAFGVSAEESGAVVGFVYGPGNGFVLYLVSIAILIFCAILIIQFMRKRQILEARILATGITIIVLSSLPLVAIIFSFPRWGYDTYFDSRHYYNPSVGAAIIFPFLIFGLAEFVSKLFRKKTFFPIIVFILFIVWLYNNMIVVNAGIKQFTQNFQPDRREVVEQLKKYLPSLPKITVFYIETDGLSAYGPVLPFQTSVPQALTVVYYDRSPLPDSFFEKPLFDGKGEGYQYSEGRGFGYYTSKKNLSLALLSNKFKTSDVYAYYYKAEEVRLLDITNKVRAEMDKYLSEAKEYSNWEKFISPSTNLSFSLPPQTEIKETIENDPQATAKSFTVASPLFIAKMTIYSIVPSFAINDYLQVASQGKLGIVNSKKVSYDRFQFNDSFVFDDNQTRKYLIKLDNNLVMLETQSINQDSLRSIEKLLGSLEVVKPL